MKELSQLRLTEYSHGAGCACKLSPVELGLVLGALPAIVDPNVLVGLAARDDAAVYRIAPDRAIVATVDFFTPIVDDPPSSAVHRRGPNAVSDIYAMVRDPLFALGITAFRARSWGPACSRGSSQAAPPRWRRPASRSSAVTRSTHPSPSSARGHGRDSSRRVVTHEGARAGDSSLPDQAAGPGLVTTGHQKGGFARPRSNARRWSRRLSA